MKKWIAFIFSLTLILGISSTVYAGTEYGERFFDGTEQIEESIASEILKSLNRFETNTNIQLRLDLVDDLNGMDIADFAEDIYDSYDYGYGDNKDGISITVYIGQDESGLQLLDYNFYYNSRDDGQREIVYAVAQAMYAATADLWTEERWDDDIQSDQTILLQAIEGCEKAGQREFENQTSEKREGYIRDLARIFSNDEETKLEEVADTISKQRDCGVYVLTVDDYIFYGYDVEDACDKLVEELDLGTGEGRDRIVLMLSMADRDYCLLRHGFGDYAVTEFGRSRIEDSFKKAFGKDDWYGGVSDFFEVCDEYLGYAREGTAYDKYDDPVNLLLHIIVKYGIAFLIGLTIAKLLCDKWKKQMQTAVAATKAGQYVVPGGVTYHVREDHFIRRTRVSTKITSSSGESHSHSSGNRTSSGKF